MGASATGLINPAFVLGRAQASSTSERVRNEALIEARALCEVRRFREALGVLNRVVLSEPSRAALAAATGLASATASLANTSGPTNSRPWPPRPIGRP